MKAEYLVEYTLKEGDEGFSAHPAVSTQHLGRVHFDPNPEYDGRRVVAVASPDLQHELLKTGNIGRHREPLFIIPTDIVSAKDRDIMRGLIDERLKELGLLKEEKKTAQTKKAVEEV